MTFQIHPLPYSPFAPLFAMSEDELAARGARREIVETAPGTPCRVSLVDAEVGETVVLTNYEHLGGASPFRASHAIYVREGAVPATPKAGELPVVLRHRLLSLRGFDEDDMMRAADVVEGGGAAALIEAIFADPAIVRIDVHNAKQGCFAARVTRA